MHSDANATRSPEQAARCATLAGQRCQSRVQSAAAKELNELRDTTITTTRILAIKFQAQYAKAEYFESQQTAPADRTARP